LGVLAAAHEKDEEPKEGRHHAASLNEEDSP
jgi:hypothetical protein